MSALSIRRTGILAALVTTLLVCSTASAQNYGPNPAPSGVFVPLANGPVAEGTTGTPVTASGSSNLSAGSGGLNANSLLSFLVGSPGTELEFAL